MALTVTVVDKYGNVLTNEELENKVIDVPGYYDLMLPIRKRINDELSKQREQRGVFVA